MAFKFVVFFATLAAVNCGLLQPAGVYQHTEAIYPNQYHQAPAAIVKQPVYAQQAYVQPAAAVYKQAHIVKQVQHEEPANYEFNYDVHDTQTGDIKQQSEKAVNGAITGQYSLIDADGYRRTVDYTADDHHGFNAQVRREPVGHQAQPVVVKKIIAQPAIAVHSAPVHQYVQAAQPAHNPWQAPARAGPWY